MRKVLPTVLIGYVIFSVFLLIDNAPAEAFQGLTLLAVIVTIAGGLFLSVARRAMRKTGQHQYYTRADYPNGQDQAPQVSHSDALDYASNPWLYGGENDPRSHAYHAKQYRQREADARQAAYESDKRRSERTRELNKWKVADE